MPTAVWRAPGRVNVIGEHTDYNEGFVLPLAIEQGCTTTATASDDGRLRITSAQRAEAVDTLISDLAPGAVDGWAAYAAGSVWALRKWDEWPAGDVGLALHVDSDVPPGAGLSSSAALTCSVAAAVDDMLGLGLTRDDLVTVARSAENDMVGAPTGGMDQMASMLCARDTVLLCDMRSLATERVPFDLRAAGLALLVTDTKTPHHHADGEYRARRESCEQAARLLGVRALRDIEPDRLDDALAALPDDTLRRRTRHVVTENARVLATVDLLRAGRIADIGPLLTRSHVSMRDDYEISAAPVDLAADTALEAGALGARMTGGGFGGCVIALVDRDRVRTMQEQIERAFGAAALDRPGFFLAWAADGAHRA